MPDAVRRSAGNRAAGRLIEEAGAAAELRRRYAEGTVRGTFLIELPAPATLQSLALAGFEFVVIDLEHSPIDLGGLPGLLAEGRALGLPTLVRVWELESGLIGKVLDLGATGVVVPRVGGAEEAATAVRAARYGPSGERGVCPLVRYSDAPIPERDAGTLVIVQIEGVDAVEHAGEIAAVPGLDGVLIGPYDLSQSLGMAGAVDAPEVLAAAAEVALQVGEEVMLGVYVDDPARSEAWAELGFRIQCVSFDGRMLLEGARAAFARTGEAR